MTPLVIDVTDRMIAANAADEVNAVLAVALVFVVLLRKLRLQEHWMRSQFGTTYEEYVRRTRALVPFIV
ncbi:MAG TPA: hypothetical protein VMU28_10305 [Terriglobales bacterium]|nr:hypothetical protein [Terriglobales bacterium]